MVHGRTSLWAVKGPPGGPITTSPTSMPAALAGEPGYTPVTTDAPPGSDGPRSLRRPALTSPKAIPAHEGRTARSIARIVRERREGCRSGGLGGRARRAGGAWERQVLAGAERIVPLLIGGVRAAREVGAPRGVDEERADSGARRRGAPRRGTTRPRRPPRARAGSSARPPLPLCDHDARSARSEAASARVPG